MTPLSILGSTGSIGVSALGVVRMHPDKFTVKALAAANNVDLLAHQIREFKPELAVVLTEEKALELEKLLDSTASPRILFGEEGYQAAAVYKSSHAVLLAMVGAAGLKPALAAIDAGKKIALANKETLVMAGDIIMARARSRGVEIFPVDSEHSAIYQCLEGNNRRELSKIFLTASGGPFRKTPAHRFAEITPGDALHHPTWNMGSKISIDSATLMNKALEIIEAIHLFDLDPEQVEVLVHPQSIVHSMVGFADGTVIAQMGMPDMKGAISYALSWPHRIPTGLSFPDFAGMEGLNFEKPDFEKFPSLGFAFEAVRAGGTMPAVMNAANEVAVEAFLNGFISFIDIFRVIKDTMAMHKVIDQPDLSEIIDADLWARNQTGHMFRRVS